MTSASEPRQLSFEPLSPVTFLERSAAAHGDRTAVIDGDRSWTYTELRQRALSLAGLVDAHGRGQPVAIIAPNDHVLLEAHFGVPLAGLPLVAINTRLSAREIAYILEHAGTRLALCHPDYADVVRQAIAAVPQRVEMLLTDHSFDSLLAESLPLARLPEDERDLLSINYTSGTTGRPKGVMYHHRGAYLQALAMAAHTGMSPSTVHLWTLPMFHCNGWCFPWAVTAAGGTHICLPKVEPAEIWRLIREHGVTHLNGAPTVLSMIGHAPEAEGGVPAREPIKIATGGAPPTPAILRRMADLGFEVTHLYGLTETFGPSVICDWRPEWDSLGLREQAALKARQGVGNMISCPVRIIDDTGHDAPADGTTMGEIALRGNNVMLGYYRDEEATQTAAPDGWFRTGDLGVMHPDGYIELRDRSKDVIISGGENITSVEVEQAISEHPAVFDVAVVAGDHERWGEVPVAFVTLRAGQTTTEEEIIAFTKSRLARYKAPASVLFGELPRTSTGKIQKFQLRERARDHRRAAHPVDGQPGAR